MEKKPIVSITYERISMKNSLPYIKCVLHLSCVVHGPIYGHFIGCTVNGLGHPTTECFQIRQKCLRWFSLCFRSLFG